MKKLLLLLFPLTCFAQVRNVQVNGSGNLITPSTGINFTSGQTLLASSGATLNFSAATVTLPATTAIPPPSSPTTGDLLVYSSGAWAKLSPGTSGFALISNGAAALPTYQAVSGSGTVTSVAATVPSFLSVAGSPITSSGTLAVTLATQNANLVFAGPASGSAAAPTFRAIVAGDLPAISAAGSNTQIQYNDSSVLAGDSGLTWNKTTKMLSSVNSSGQAIIQITSTNNTSNSALQFSTKDSGAVTRSGGLYFIPSTSTANSFFALSGDSLTIHSTVYGDGRIQFNTYGAGALVSDSSGNLTSTGTPQLTRLGVGQAADAITPLVTTLNSGTAPAALSGTGLQVVGADSASARIVLDSFAGTPVINLRRADGTNASKSAVQLDDQIGALGALGYGATGYASGSRSTLLFAAAENWTDTAQGTYVSVLTTSTGSASGAEAMRITAAKNILVGTTSESGLSGGGNLKTNAKLMVGTGVVADSGGIKHARVTTGSVSAAATALVTITWTTAFADANYTTTASVQEATTSSLSMSVVHIESQSASAVTVRVLNNAAGSLTGTVHVIAIHD